MKRGFSLLLLIVLGLPGWSLAWEGDGRIRRERIFIPSMDPVVKSEGSFVYCLAGMSRSNSSHHVYRDALTVLHVQRDSGEARILAETGQVRIRSRRLKFFDSRLIGLVTDEEHLYLALWEARSWDTSAQRILKDPEVRGEDHSLRMRFRLAVFDLESGRLIDTAAVPDDRAPEVATPEDIPEQTTEHGVLELEDDGVTVFGVTAALREGALKWEPAPATQPAAAETPSE